MSVRGFPATLFTEAMAGDPVAVHALVPVSEQARVFSIEGRRWPLERGRMARIQMKSGLPGDYLHGDHRELYRRAGLWGLFRVFAADDPSAGLQPLPDR